MRSIKYLLIVLFFITAASTSIAQGVLGRWEVVKVETEEGEEQGDSWIEFTEGRFFYTGPLETIIYSDGGEYEYDKKKSTLSMKSGGSDKNQGVFKVSKLTATTAVIKKKGRKIYLERVKYKTGNIDADAAWKYEYGEGSPNRNPAVDSEHVYFGSIVTGVKCLDRKTGDLIWISDAPVGRKGFFHTIAQDEKNIYTNGTQGIIYKISKKDGKVVWKLEAKFDDDILNKITVIDGVLYANPLDGTFLALDTDGKELWRTAVEGAVMNYTISDGRIYGNDANGNLVVLDAKTGTILHQKMISERSRYATEPAVVEETVIVLHPEAGTIKAFDLEMNERWSDTTNLYSQFFQGGEALLVMQGENLIRLNPKDGTVVWSFTVGEVRLPPTFHDGKLYIQGTKNFIVLDVKTGALLYLSSFQNSSFTQPLITNEEMILGYYGIMLSVANPF